MFIRLLTSDFGGPFVWGRDLASGMCAQGVEVDHVHNRWQYGVNTFWQTGTDIVHTTVPFPVKFWSRPMVVSVMGDYTVEKHILQRFYPALIRRAGVVTSLSKFMKNKVEMENAVVIPNAVVPERFKMAQHGTRDRLNVATILNFYFKGKAEGAVRMVDLMRRAELGDSRHIVVGDGPYCQTVKDAARGTGLNIKFSGLLYDPTIVLANSDLFLYYSLHDNFPTVLLEAMASGLPVLTNNVGAVPEIIEDGVDGFVVDNDDDYIHRLRQLMGDAGLRQALGLKARESVEEKFNWSMLIPRYVEIYERLCG